MVLGLGRRGRTRRRLDCLGARDFRPEARQRHVIGKQAACLFFDLRPRQRYFKCRMLRNRALIGNLGGATQRRIDDCRRLQRGKLLHRRLPFGIGGRTEALAKFLRADFGHDAGKADGLLLAVAVIAQAGKFANVNVPRGRVTDRRLGGIEPCHQCLLKLPDAMRCRRHAVQRGKGGKGEKTGKSAAAENRGHPSKRRGFASLGGRRTGKAGTIIGRSRKRHDTRYSNRSRIPGQRRRDFGTSEGRADTTPVSELTGSKHDELW